MTFYSFFFLLNNQCKGKRGLECCPPWGLVQSPRVQPGQYPAASWPPTRGHCMEAAFLRACRFLLPAPPPRWLLSTARVFPEGNRGEGNNLALEISPAPCSLRISKTNAYASDGKHRWLKRGLEVKGLGVLVSVQHNSPSPWGLEEVPPRVWDLFPLAGV